MHSQDSLGPDPEDPQHVEGSVLEERIDRLEREFPRITKTGKVLGKILRGICAFFYSLGHALLTEDKKKTPKKKKEEWP